MRALVSDSLVQVCIVVPNDRLARVCTLGLVGDNLGQNGRSGKVCGILECGI